MASFLPNPDPGFNVTVTNEEFNLFHSIDRKLFTRFVVGLGRDTTQSTHVMAFIMWVEKKINDDKTVPNLLRWPDGMLNNLADEVVIILNCIESPHFPHPSTNENNLPLVQNLMHCTTITLQYFHVNRIEIITAVTKLLNDVCVRAFTDIVQQVQYARAMKEHNMYLSNVYGGMNLNPHHNMQPHVVYYAPGVTIVPQQQVVVPKWNEENSNTLDTYDVSGGKKDFNPNISDIFANLDLEDHFVAADDSVIAGSDERKKVLVDDRTIFMTFSKGYPISEFEVQEFFTRKYGDIIEAMFMQDVQPPDQPLYARLVIRPEATYVIDHFLENNGKIKFAINGKHVWARRFIRKSPPSPFEAGPSNWS